MSVPQPTRVPLAVRALVAIGEAMKAADKVDIVLLGPTPQGATHNARTLAFLVSGVAADVNRRVIPGQVDVYSESLDVTFNAISWSGGTDIGVHMDACADMLSELKARIGSDPTLGGVCEYATIGARETWATANDREGASVALAGTVRVESYV
jgi:hypothetical protein